MKYRTNTSRVCFYLISREHISLLIMSILNVLQLKMSHVWTFLDFSLTSVSRSSSSASPRYIAGTLKPPPPPNHTPIPPPFLLLLPILLPSPLQLVRLLSFLLLPPPLRASHPSSPHPAAIHYSPSNAAPSILSRPCIPSSISSILTPPCFLCRLLYPSPYPPSIPPSLIQPPQVFSSSPH